jgi:ribonuclease Z
MKVKILGCNSATPAFGRHPTSQVVNIKEQLFLIDCGEGTQMQMQKFGVKRNRINHIFISHLHGDHYFGLIGFLNSLALYGREKEMHIYCHEPLKKIIEIQLFHDLSFPLHFHFLNDNEEQTIYDSDSVQVKSFPVYHSIETCGFLFSEKERKRVLLPAECRHYEVPQYFYKRLTAGEDYTRKGGEVIKNEWLTQAGKTPSSYAYTADTAPHEKYFEIIKNVDLLYHEATFEEAHLDKAINRKHSTAKQAAEIAKNSSSKKLLIGHYSSRYKELDRILAEAKAIFEHTVLAIEGEEIEV